MTLPCGDGTIMTIWNCLLTIEFYVLLWRLSRLTLLWPPFIPRNMQCISGINYLKRCMFVSLLKPIWVFLKATHFTVPVISKSMCSSYIVARVSLNYMFWQCLKTCLPLPYNWNFHPPHRSTRRTHLKFNGFYSSTVLGELNDPAPEAEELVISYEGSAFREG